MTIDQSIKNKILASKIDTADGRYMVDWHVLPRKCLFLHFTFIFNLKILNIVIHENLKLLEVETVEISESSFDWISVTFLFYSVLFYQHYVQCKGFIKRKIER